VSLCGNNVGRYATRETRAPSSAKAGSRVSPPALGTNRLPSRAGAGVVKMSAYLGAARHAGGMDAAAIGADLSVLQPSLSANGLDLGGSKRTLIGPSCAAVSRGTSHFGSLLALKNKRSRFHPHIRELTSIDKKARPKGEGRAFADVPTSLMRKTMHLNKRSGNAGVPPQNSN
jgi:hypothetical protein